MRLGKDQKLYQLDGAAWSLRLTCDNIATAELRIEGLRKKRNILIRLLADKQSPEHRSLQDLMAISGLSRRSLKRIIATGDNG